MTPELELPLTALRDLAEQEDLSEFVRRAVRLVDGDLAGAFIPILLENLGVDPAIASSIFVTTFTDVCGFLLLLGLGAILLM